MMREVVMRSRRTAGAVLRTLLRWLVSWVVAVVIFAALLMPGSRPLSHHADQAQARLDREIMRAQQYLGIPYDLLAPIIDEEDQVVGGTTTWNRDDTGAATTYRLLLRRVQQVESTNSDALQVRTQNDLSTLQEAVSDARIRGFSEVAAYQARLEQAMRSFARAKTLDDYGRLDQYIVGQIESLQSLKPAYQKLLLFGSMLQALHLIGMPSALGEYAYAQDEQTFRNGTRQRFSVLEGDIDGQVMQVAADVARSLPAMGTRWLEQMQQRVGALRRAGDKRAAEMLQRIHDQDRRSLASARTAADYLTLSQHMMRQADEMSLPLLQLQIRDRLSELRTLILRAQQQHTRDPFTGRSYPAAYEYADAARGYGAVQREVDTAHGMDALRKAGHDIAIMTTNVRAMVQNLHDPTPHNRPHQTDMSLLRQYDLLQGKVIVVSLREQTTRFYDAGRLVYWTYTTTGMLQRPTPPGLYYAMSKSSPLLFTTTEPRDSPYWFAPTPVHFAIAYLPGGFYLHDASWRHRFGPGTNLPHDDPAAFNGGSHGCINYTEAQMRWIYAWTVVGTPIVIY